MGRRLIYSIILSLIPYNYEITLRITIFLVMLASLYMQHMLKPYASNLENRMELVCLYTLIMSFFGGLLFNFYGFAIWLFVLIVIPNLFVIGAFAYLLYPRVLHAARRLTVALRFSSLDFAISDLKLPLRASESSPYTSDPKLSSPVTTLRSKELGSASE
eukprot:TRINITY_DN5486_c0_g1_i1.p1 TRINITY_DN5486_c0_g1~~TRINITY_DN5486_c0_g1_i1.p1  ORF type:complete len:160 (-),score=34.93 TRINITY_DN5486_c0_g1_i1:217-696(-)